MHQLVVLNYMMASHTATLAAIARDRGPIPAEPGYLPVIEAVVSNMKSGRKSFKPMSSGNSMKIRNRFLSEMTQRDQQGKFRIREEENKQAAGMKFRNLRNPQPGRESDK